MALGAATLYARGMRTGLIALGILSLVSASCSGTASSARSGRAAAARPAVAVFVASHPVTQEGSAYDAGRIIAAHVARALEPKVASVELIEAPDESRAMDRAHRSGLTLLFIPSIEQWEDRESKWAATVPDLLSVQIALRDVATGDLLGTARYKARGRQQYLSGNPVIEDMLDDKFRRIVQDMLKY